MGQRVWQYHCLTKRSIYKLTSHPESKSRSFYQRIVLLLLLLLLLIFKCNDIPFSIHCPIISKASAGGKFTVESKERPVTVARCWLSPWILDLASTDTASVPP